MRRSTPLLIFCLLIETVVSLILSGPAFSIHRLSNLSRTSRRRIAPGRSLFVSSATRQEDHQQSDASTISSKILESLRVETASWKEDDFDWEEDDAQISPFYRQDNRERNDPSLSPLSDPAGLASLLEQRYHARRAGNYAQVSELDRKLKREHRVKAYDHPPIWTRLLTSPPTAFRRRQAQKQTRQMQRAFGPTGHPYRQVGEINIVICDLTLTEIHALLQRRTLCRANEQFEEADAVLFELSVHGVRLCDNTLQWTADPNVAFDKQLDDSSDQRDESPAAVTTALRSSALQYTRDALSKPFAQEPVRFQQRVEQLVQARAQAIVRGEIELANDLAVELYCSYNVGINDETLTWSVGCQFLAGVSQWNPPPRPTKENDVLSNCDANEVPFPSSRLLFGDKEWDFDSATRYRCSSQSLPIPTQNKDRVKVLVQERIHKREEARFLEADALRRELWYTYVSSA